MKTIDNIEASSRSYYFLLDWNEKIIGNTYTEKEV